MIREQSLLDWLQAATQSRVLSDLRVDMRRTDLFDKLCKQISRCPEDAYPLSEWKSAAEYLTRAPCRATTVMGVKTFIYNAAAPPPGQDLNEILKQRKEEQP